jgi:hypothetical protein
MMPHGDPSETNCPWLRVRCHTYLIMPSTLNVKYLTFARCCRTSWCSPPWRLMPTRTATCLTKVEIRIGSQHAPPPQPWGASPPCMAPHPSWRAATVAHPGTRHHPFAKGGARSARDDLNSITKVTYTLIAPHGEGKCSRMENSPPPPSPRLRATAMRRSGDDEARKRYVGVTAVSG